MKDKILQSEFLQNKIIKNNIWKNEKLYYSIWALNLFLYLTLTQSELTYISGTSLVYKLIQLISIGIIFLKFIIVEDKKSKFFKYSIIIFILICIVTLKSRSTFWVTQFIFILGAKDTNFDKLLKVDIITKLVSLVVVILLLVFNIINNFTSTINGSFKQGLGFIHPNILAVIFISILIEFLYIKYKSINYKDYIVLFIGTFIINYFTSARSSIYAFILILLTSIIFKFIKSDIIKNVKLIKILILNSAIILFLLSLILTYLYYIKNPFVMKLNSILTGRIGFMKIFFEEYGISIFGKNVQYISTRTSLLTGEKNKILDNSYIKMFIQYGSASLAGFLYILRKSIDDAIENNKINILFIIMFFIIIGFVESHTLNIFYNLSLVYILTKEGVKWNKNEC